MKTTLKRTLLGISGLLLIACGTAEAQTTIRMEAEDMTLDTYKVETLSFASNGALINLKGPGVVGSATASFPGETGTYDVTVVYHDENDGVAQLSVSIAGNTVDSWSLDASISGGQQPEEFNRFTREIATGWTISNGDEIRIDGLQGNWDHANVDYIEFVGSGPGPAPSIPTVTVAKSGGDYTNPLYAVANISEGDKWCREPGTYEPCQINIAPGTYEVNETLRIPGAITIIGAGSEATTIAAALGVEVALYVGEGHVTLNELTIRNESGNGSSSIGVRIGDCADLDISDARVHARGSTANTGVVQSGDCSGTSNFDRVMIGASGGTTAIGMDLESYKNVTDSRIYASSDVGTATKTIGLAFRDCCGSDGGRLEVTNSQIQVLPRSLGSEGVGILVQGDGSYSVHIHRSTLGAFDVSVAERSVSILREPINANALVGLGLTRLLGPVIGDAKCAGVYDENYDFYTDTCP
jgi:hypothetical protein